MPQKSGFVHHILCESPFIPRDFYAIRPLIYGIFWVYFFGFILLLIWGVGVVEIVFSGCLLLERLLPFFHWKAYMYKGWRAHQH